jgi:Tfp pilus assembly PilM family ATPase
MSEQRAIGLAIDAGAVEVVELSADAGRITILRAAREPLAPGVATAKRPVGMAKPGVFAGGAVADPHALAKVVRRLLKRAGLSRRNLFIALGGNRVIARVVELEAATPEEAQRTLEDRIARYAVFEDTEVNWQAAPLEDAEPGKQSYLSAAAAADAIPPLLQAFHAAGIQVAYVEPHALAGLRALAAREAGEPNVPPTVLVSLGAERTEFIIARGNRPLLIRSVDVGLEALASAPAAADDLLVEAKRCVEFCRSRFPDEAPRVWLRAPGGAETVVRDVLARLAQLAPPLAVEEAPRWATEAPAEAPDSAADASWAAVGAALASLGRDDAALLNLVSPEWPETQKVRHQVLGLAASIGGVLLVTFALVTSLRLTVGDVARRVEGASLQMHRNTTEVLEAAELKHRAATAVGNARLWNRVRAHLAPFDWVAGLQAVIEQTPESVRITRLTVKEGLLRIAGEARSPDDAHEFVRRLASLRLLDEARMERLERAPAKGSPFIRCTITCRFHETVPEPAPADPSTRLRVALSESKGDNAKGTKR